MIASTLVALFLILVLIALNAFLQGGDQLGAGSRGAGVGRAALRVVGGRELEALADGGGGLVI